MVNSSALSHIKIKHIYYHFILKEDWAYDGDKGFSILELSVVLSVIAILTAIALPAFFGVNEMAADRLVRHTMIEAYKQCKIGVIRDKSTPQYTVMLSMHRANGYYKFYQKYHCIRRRDGSCEPTKIGNCFGPLGAHQIGVRKFNGTGIGGELWLDLDTGKKTDSGGIRWED